MSYLPDFTYLLHLPGSCNHLECLSQEKVFTFLLKDATTRTIQLFNMKNVDSMLLSSDFSSKSRNSAYMKFPSLLILSRSNVNHKHE